MTPVSADFNPGLHLPKACNASSNWNVLKPRKTYWDLLEGVGGIYIDWDTCIELRLFPFPSGSDDF